MAWNWSANKAGKERERFAGPLVIFGLVGAGLLLLVVLYPEKSLLKLLRSQEVSSQAQRNYLEALIRKRSDDNYLILALAGSHLTSRSPDKALEVLDKLKEPLTADVKRSGLQMRYDALLQRLLFLPVNSSEWLRTRQLFSAHIELMIQGGATRQEMEVYRAEASRIGDTGTANKLQALLGSPPPPSSESKKPTPDSTAATAIANRDYRGAAAICFAAMKNSRDINKRRRFFLAGVRALQSGNLPVEALAAGETYINGLSEDREVLLFMTRLALAANRPDRSKIYVERALGMSTADREVR